MSATLTTNPWRQVREESLSTMTATERAEYDAGAPEAKIHLPLAELVYNAHSATGLTRTELVRRTGSRQSAMPAVEGGAQNPRGVVLARIAQALSIDPAA